MKELLIYAGVGFAVIQTLILLAVMAAAARPIPKFQPEFEETIQPRERKPERELELVC